MTKKDKHPYSQALCCDWGTSSLRVRLIDIPSISIIDEIISPQGIATVHKAWKKEHSLNERSSRVNFYLDALIRAIRESSMATAFPNTIETPIIISGMASSSIGMMELPYAELPFSIHGEDAVIREIPSPGIVAPVILISGVKDGNEVMRGEEAQLIGIADLLEERQLTDETMILLPGTHSKHLLIQSRQIIRINTYLTGELFNALCKNGITKESVVLPKTFTDGNGWDAFCMGVRDGQKSSLLNALFKVRTNQLFDKLSKENNYQYMSGLLIGNELSNLFDTKPPHVVLCCDANLFDHYSRALKLVGVGHSVSHISPKETALATVSGQLKVFERYVGEDDGMHLDGAKTHELKKTNN